ncbi:MAG TPA: hypothetical protein VHP32_06750 [Ignavibacteria bacterium]|nr:hypothetical protein [Ignavibacteria bacterium]
MSQNTSALQTFIERVNNSDSGDSTQDTQILELLTADELIKEIEHEIFPQDLVQKLVSCKHEKIKIKEVKLESEIDFIKSVNQLKGVFQTELDAALEEVRTKYSEEMLNLQVIRQKEIFGSHLINLINVLSLHECCLVMKDNTIWAYKYYSPPYEVSVGTKGNNANDDSDDYTVQYDSPVCKIKSIYVNLLHPKITLGTIMLNTEGRHPNAQAPGLTSVCNGTLEDRDISLSNPEELITLLDEICHTYEVMNLKSAYWQPHGSFKKVEETAEAAWNSN